MEKRLGIIAIVISDKKYVEEVNRLISTYNHIIVARQGIPMVEEEISFISLVVKAPMNHINLLTGKLGRLDGIEVKTIVTKHTPVQKSQGNTF
jgi:putative iron-only hydrogenase system regulator